MLRLSMDPLIITHIKKMMEFDPGFIVHETI